MRFSTQLVVFSILVAASPALAEEATADAPEAKLRLDVSIQQVKVALVGDHAELVVNIRVNNVRGLLEKFFGGVAPEAKAEVTEPPAKVEAPVVAPQRVVGGRVQMLTEAHDEFGFLVRRILVTDRGSLFDLTFRDDGALVGVEPAGNALDLPVVSSETIEDGLMVDRMRDTSERLIECARTAEALIVCTAVTPRAASAE